MKKIALALGALLGIALLLNVIIGAATKSAPELDVAWTEDMGELIEIQIVNYQSLAVRVTFIYENGTIVKTVFGLVFRITLSDVGG